ncbi:MAG: DUF937 domain-containing protein [Hyphomicrobium sp.]|jgi:hypothetical protein
MRDALNRGPIWREFTLAQNALAIDNVARAFHLPRPKAKTAIIEMLSALRKLIDEQSISRGTLARLIELLGKHNYELILDDPTLMGATSTQVIGTEALTVLAGHNNSEKIASHAATEAQISQMIAEYLLPVVAAMFMGALSARTRGSLLALARNEEVGDVDNRPAERPASSNPLPIGRGSSGFFSGATIKFPGAGQELEKLYVDLAERIRAGGEDDAINIARRIMAEGVGVRPRNAAWLAETQRWALTTVQEASRHIQERLRNLRSRQDK